MALLLSACGTNGVVINDYCILFSPIRVSRADVLTDGTARQILAQNETWGRVCR